MEQPDRVEEVLVLGLFHFLCPRLGRVVGGGDGGGCVCLCVWVNARVDGCEWMLMSLTS